MKPLDDYHDVQERKLRVTVEHPRHRGLGFLRREPTDAAVESLLRQSCNGQPRPTASSRRGGEMINLIESEQEKVAELCRLSGARRLDAFGSAVRDDFDPATSDLDFLVEFDALPPARYAASYFLLKEGLEALFRRQVDLVTEPGLANPHFRERVYAERRTVYAR